MRKDSRLASCFPASLIPKQADHLVDAPHMVSNPGLHGWRDVLNARHVLRFNPLFFNVLDTTRLPRLWRVFKYFKTATTSKRPIQQELYVNRVFSPLGRFHILNHLHAGFLKCVPGAVLKQHCSRRVARLSRKHHGHCVAIH